MLNKQQTVVTITTYYSYLRIMFRGLFWDKFIKITYWYETINAIFSYA